MCSFQCISEKKKKQLNDAMNVQKIYAPIRLKSKFNQVLPGHEFVLHATEWYALQGLLRQLTGLQVAPRGQLHALPPPDQVHVLVLVFIPPPHVAEHRLKFDQRFHFPSPYR